MTMNELVAQYNALAKAAGLDPVKRFRSKDAAQEAIAQLEARKGEIHWPATQDGLKAKVRDGSLGSHFLKAMQSGATLNALIKIIETHGQPSKDKPEHRVRSTMRMLHRYNGYGVRQEGNKFFVVEP